MLVKKSAKNDPHRDEVVNFNFKMTIGSRDDFDAACAYRGAKMSIILRNFVESYIEAAKRDKEINAQLIRDEAKMTTKKKKR